ncbi:MAG: Hsp20/alpha crystallin family protein [Candidatus Peribacteraceae bacterium]|jgi:HSP20 family protein
MNPSPFHGIFSAFNQEQLSSDVSAAPEAFGAEVQHAHPVSSSGQITAQTTGQIAVDIYEQDGYYIIRAPIAGVKLSDLDIEVDDKILTIRGVRAMTDVVPTDQYYIQECFWGEFRRSITLPCSIDPKRVKATFSKDCILKILIPREEKVKIVRVSEG